jgi:hypothetical protein
MQGDTYSCYWFNSGKPICYQLIGFPLSVIYSGCAINMDCSGPDPSKGVCADPVNGAAILGKGGLDPQGGNKERQLSPDKGRGKT